MNYPNERYILQSKLNKDIREVLKSYICIEHIFSYMYCFIIIIVVIIIFFI